MYVCMVITCSTVCRHVYMYGSTGEVRRPHSVLFYFVISLELDLIMMIRYLVYITVWLFYMFCAILIGPW